MPVRTSEENAVRVLRWVVPTVIVGIFLQRAFGGTDPVLRFFDDFFYYVKPAQNLVEGAGSVYFPGEPTNGYHPLWFLWLTLLWWITGGGSAFFGLVDLTLMPLMVGFFFLYQRFLRRVIGQELPAVIGAALAALILTAMSTLGVELALTVFAVALLLDVLTRKPLAQQGVKDVAVIGLLGSFLVLSRLDAAILAPGLAIAIGRQWDWKRWTALAAGAVPVAVYLAFNWFVYGHLATTSMSAKSLDVYWPPNLYGASLYLPMPVGVNVILTVVATAVLLRRSAGGDVRRIALALTTAPLLQLAFHSFLSGWMVFDWYLYLGIMVLGMAAGLLASRCLQAKALRLYAIPLSLGGVLIAAVVVVYISITPERHQGEIAVIARDLQSFSAQRPGVYAMGDAAGAAGWLMSQPVVHLEGLMMSHAFIDRIRERQPLEQVFRDYHVNYFVSVWSEDVGNGCRHFLEPAPMQSSPRAPHMEMTTCAQPIAVLRSARAYQVRIYRIDPHTGQAI